MSVYVGESRGELLTWINGLLDTHPENAVTKVEQCGSGVIYCQIMDSIYGNLPMSRLKFDAKQEYAYLDNFKVLQQCFKKNGIDKPIPVEKLVKCKMQDNLEFLQWMKKFWDANNSGMAYDAQGRSNGQAVAPAQSRAPPAKHTGGNRATPSSSSTANRTTSAASNIQLQQLNAQVEEMQLAYDGIERERMFYFEKLRKVELIVQARSAVEGISPEETDVLGKITEILYSTEEGFELPENGEEGHEEEETY